MSDPICRLMYGSENRLRGSEAEIEAEIGAIMASSTRNNRAVGITGALLFTARNFTQVLEGPRVEVERTFERISQDLRHGDVVLIDLQAVAERAFTSWSMTLLNMRGQSGTRAIAQLTASAAENCAGRPIVELLQRFLVRRAAPLGTPAETPPAQSFARST